MPTLRTPPRSRRSAAHADALYGLLYPANRVRLLAVTGDPLDSTRVLLTFDRDVAAAPASILMWAGDHHAGPPALANPRVCRVPFAFPLSAGMPWSFDPAYGSFAGADGSAAALACSGVLADVAGPLPAGKIYLAGVTRVDELTVDFAFSAPVTVGAGDPGGFWADAEGGVQTPAAGTAQQDGQTVRASFPAAIPDHTHAGLFGGFAGVDEWPDVLAPAQWRI